MSKGMDHYKKKRTSENKSKYSTVIKLVQADDDDMGEIYSVPYDKVGCSEDFITPEFRNRLAMQEKVEQSLRKGLEEQKAKQERQSKEDDDYIIADTDSKGNQIRVSKKSIEMTAKMLIGD